MTEYIVEPKSRQNLRNLTLILRKFLNLENEKYFPITELLDVLAEIFDNFTYEIVEDNEMPFGTHADTNTLTGHIRIRESVYEGACNGNGRDRMTIAHELGHYFTICFCEFKLERNFANKKVKTYAFCCDGVSKGGTIAVGSHGCIKVNIERIYFERGMSEIIKRLEPKRIIVYGATPDYIFDDYIKSGIEIIQYNSDCSSCQKAVSA